MSLDREFGIDKSPARVRNELPQTIVEETLK